MRPAKVLLGELRCGETRVVPGMVRVAPSRTMFRLDRWLALAIELMLTPYRCAMPLNVSPATTRCVRRALVVLELEWPPGTFSVSPAMIRFPLPGRLLTWTSLATVV